MSLRRVVVTGLGIVSCIGNDQDTVTQSLKDGKSGIVFSPKYAEMGFRSHVEGRPNINLEEAIDRKLLRFMGEGAAYNYIAMQQAIENLGFEPGKALAAAMPGTGRVDIEIQRHVAFLDQHNPIRKRFAPSSMPNQRIASGISARLGMLRTIWKVESVSFSEVRERPLITRRQRRGCRRPENR